MTISRDDVRDALLLDLLADHELSIGTVSRLRARGLTRLSEVAALSAAELFGAGTARIGIGRYRELREVCIDHGFWRAGDPRYPYEEPPPRVDR